jgi:hypothetical protein
MKPKNTGSLPTVLHISLPRPPVVVARNLLGGPRGITLLLHSSLLIADTYFRGSRHATWFGLAYS